MSGYSYKNQLISAKECIFLGATFHRIRSHIGQIYYETFSNMVGGYHLVNFVKRFDIKC